jgi:hypothetical protein
MYERWGIHSAVIQFIHDQVKETGFRFRLNWVMRWIRLLGQVFRFLGGKIIQLVVVVAVEM